MRRKYGYRTITPYIVLVYSALNPGLHTVDELRPWMFVNVARKYVRLLGNEHALTVLKLQGYKYGFMECPEYYECRQYRYTALRRRIHEIMPLLKRIVEILVTGSMPRERRIRKMMDESGGTPHSR